ncbi:serine hydrolase [Candidatus Bipolaricaulota bacterium]|nr:serine hydrolase [Candidatus Bipolaricaulota bacterium]
MNSQKLENFIFDKMSETNLPGVSLRLIKDGEVLISKGFGFRNIEDGLSSTDNTLYGIGSITKSFTAISIMQLKERGELDTEDPVKKYLPLEIEPKGEPIRIKHLLTHSSGIPALAYAESSIRRTVGAGENWTPISDVEDMMNFVSGAGDWVHSKPGARWFYLNEGYVLLGAIIAKCSGSRYEEFVKENILSPLGMDKTFFDLEKIKCNEDAAVPYVLTKDGDQIPSKYTSGAISADGALISNVVDLSYYLQMYLNKGKLDGNRIVTKESLREMESYRVPTPSIEGPFGKSTYGYGLRITEDFFGHQLIGHGGSVLVSTGYVGFIPEENTGISILANGSGYPLSHLGMYGLALVLGRNREECPFIHRELALKELEGVYETYHGTMSAEVKKTGDLMEIKIENKYTKNTTLLIPEEIGKSKRQFYYLDGCNKIPVDFDITEDGIELIFERYALRKIGELT